MTLGSVASLASLVACVEGTHPHAQPAMEPVANANASPTTTDEPAVEPSPGDAGPIGAGPTKLGNGVPEPASRDLDATVATGTTSPTASTASTVPQVVLGASQALGTMAAADIERGVRARTAIFRACYDFGLRKVPKLEGAVSISYVITKTGGVRSVAVANETLGHKPTIACIVHGFTSARFTPRPKDEVTVTSPLTFVAPLAGAGKRAAH